VHAPVNITLRVGREVSVAYLIRVALIRTDGRIAPNFLPIASMKNSKSAELAISLTGRECGDHVSPSPMVARIVTDLNNTILAPRAIDISLNWGIIATCRSVSDGGRNHSCCTE